jgi:NAD(P)-dependent dehydrogenase (short-subunit alcohol dehydrogenase family)
MGFLCRQFFVTPRYPTGNFDGKTVVITGSDNGRGKRSSTAYARLSASRLILSARSLEKGEAAKQDIARTMGNANIDVWHLDMSDYARSRRRW